MTFEVRRTTLGSTFDLEEPIQIEVDNIQYNPEFLKSIRPTATAFASVKNPGLDDPSALTGRVVRVVGQLWKVVGVETYRLHLPYPHGMQFCLALEPIPVEEDMRFPGPVIYAGGRAAGKTRRAIEWLKQGQKFHPVDGQARGYPGWSRVLVVVDMQQHRWLKSTYYHEIEDFDHRVYFWQDWTAARGVRASDVEVMVDNADMVLSRLLLNGRLAAITMSSEVEHLDAAERV